MKKITLMITSLILSTLSNAQSANQNKKIIEILQDSKVPIKTETSEDGSRSTEGGNGNGGRPKIQK